MNLNHQLCYTAIKSRDARFDGQFFTGVTTTGIYCRPICPAKTPRQENVQFFVSAAAAEAAGFRPCLRCCPESAPGSPEWEGTSAVVSRALRLMGEGVLDEGGVEGLAGRLNLSSRQLRRLFDQHLGAPPIVIAQTRRVHFAKKLLLETNLPVTEVAFCAGFSSVRRFNAALRQTYGHSPSHFRRGAKAKTTLATEKLLTLKLAYRPPFAWQELIQFLGNRSIPGVEVVETNKYQRTIQIGPLVGAITITYLPNQTYLLLTIPVTFSKHIVQIVERVRQLFDLGANPNKIATHLVQDERLAHMGRTQPGLRIPGAWDGFEIAVRAILGQQISVKAATTLAGRLAQRYGQTLPEPANDGLTHLFPSPERLLTANLTEIGVIAKRAEAIRHLARAVIKNDCLLKTSQNLEDAIEQLTALPGIGDWTAHYIAMRVLGEPDAFPAGDLVLRRAAADHPDTPLTEAQLRQRAEVWQPWRAYAAIYLWSQAGKVAK